MGLKPALTCKSSYTCKMFTFDALLCNLLILWKSRKTKNVPPPFTVISMVKILKKRLK